MKLTIKRTPLFLSGLVGMLGVAGCALEPDVTSDAVDDHVADIMGTGTPPLASVVRIRVTGQAEVHSGILVGNAGGSTLVLTSERWVSWQTSPSTVTVGVPGAGGTFTTRTARFINDTAWFSGAVLQINAVTSNQFPIETTAPASLIGRWARCYAYTSDTTMQYADIQFTAASGNDLTYVPRNGQLNTTDAGAPCILDGTTFVGFVRTGHAGGGLVHHAGNMRPWLDGMANLAATRDDNRSLLVSIHTRPQGVSGVGRMCLDVPWGSPYPGYGVNQYRCHHGPRQRFWLDFRADADNPRLVNEAGGLCIDVPSGSPLSGINLQVYPCHSGFNQRFAIDLWPTGNGIRFRPFQIPLLPHCLSVEGGPSNATLPTEQRTCGAPPSLESDQRWYLQINPTYTP